MSFKYEVWPTSWPRQRQKGCKLQRLSVSERVYLERVSLFFGHAGGNAVAIFIGAALMIAVLRAAGVPVRQVAIWLHYTQCGEYSLSRIAF